VKGHLGKLAWGDIFKARQFYTTGEKSVPGNRKGPTAQSTHTAQKITGRFSSGSW